MTAYVLLSCISCFLVAKTYGASIAAKDTNDILKLSTLLYTTDHSVTSLGVLLDKEDASHKTIFFIETEINDRGERIDYGLHVLKNNTKTKLLDNARDIAVVNLDMAYFAAKDGIYYYNKQENSAQKYGSTNDEVISIAVENGTGVLYYLNKQNQLYKVTEDGRKTTIVDAVKNAQEIVTDNAGRLVYYSVDKSFYIYDGNEIRKVEGVPNNMKNVRFIKTPILVDNCALFNGDDQYYGIQSGNATVVPLGEPQHKFEASAVSMDAGVVIFFAKDKKIYEFNLIEKIIEGLLEALSEKFKSMVQDLQRALNSLKPCDTI